MALLEFNADLGRVASALERIAASLEMAITTESPPAASKPAGEGALIDINNIVLWEMEQEKAAQIAQGLVAER